MKLISIFFDAGDGRRRGLAYLACAFSVAVVLGLWLVAVPPTSSAQNAAVAVSSGRVIRLGEKLGYNLYFAKIPNAGYLETHIVSRGKLSGKDALEIRGRVRTLDVVSAAFLLLDESRTTFASPDGLLPHHITTTSLGGISPKETVRNYLAQPTSSYDFLTLLLKARENGGIGTFSLQEGDTVSTVTLVPAGTEKVRTGTGDFDSNVSLVQSDLLAAHGIKELRINFSTDEFKVPVLFRAKTARGEFRAVLATISLPDPVEVPAPTASPTPTPAGKATPPARPSPTPPTYIENEPLVADLSFELGEVLDYRLSAAGKPVGTLSLNARERKLLEKTDSLLLTATVTGVEPGTAGIGLGDGALVHVDPETLAPMRSQSRFTAPMVGLNQTVMFDRRTGAINFGAKAPTDAPIGTHSFLSLIYAMRSFNLKPSKDASNPVNDTRVSVFWDSAAYVFTLRPGNPAELTLNGEKISAQLITVKTNNKDLDALNLRVWLRTDDRVPVKFAAGAYEAELTSVSNLFRR